MPKKMNGEIDTDEREEKAMRVRKKYPKCAAEGEEFRKMVLKSK